MQIQVKRIYDASLRTDGLRVLVDRLWPRGLKKENAAIDTWAKELAPSNGLRRWFAHESVKFAQFRGRYRAELKQMAAEMEELIALAAGRPITLLYAAKDTQHNNAVVLQEWLLSSPM